MLNTGFIGPELTDSQRDFIHMSAQSGALIFSPEGLLLKSGRISPWFFNAGNLLQTAKGISKVTQIYVDLLLEKFANDGKIRADILYGPAYKGIPLAVVTAQKYFDLTGNDIGIASHRKELKQTGEGGDKLFMDVGGKDVIILDDAVSAGTAFGISKKQIQADGGNIQGMVVILDRKEMPGGVYPHEIPEKVGALEYIGKQHSIQVIASVTRHMVRQAIEEGIIGNEEIAHAMDRYHEQFGVE